VCCGLAHRTVRCARTVQLKPAILGFLQAPSAIIHRTVRCASGATTIQRNGRLQKPLTQMNNEEQCTESQSIESEAHRTVNRTCQVWHRTVWCHKRTSSPTVDWVRTLTVGWRGGAPDCPVRPSTAAFPNGHLVVEGYKYPPTTTTPSIQAFWTFHSIQEQYTSLQDTIKAIDPLKVPKSTLVH
jgi:hypothetical protein